MATTLDTIAKRLGVSRMAVSYALRGKPGVAEDTRRKIQQVAEELGYRPNAAARAIRRGHFGAIGLLYSANADATQRIIHPNALWAIQQPILDRHLRLTLAPIDDEQLDDPTKMHNILGEWPVDGLLVHYTHRPPATLRDILQRHQVPSIWLHSRLEADCVYNDDEAAGYEAVQRLLEQGHTRIAYASFAGISEHNGSDDRQNGYRRAMNEAGRTPTFIPDVPCDVIGGQQNDVARACLDATDAPSAVVTRSKVEAEALLLAAAQLGRDVPGDLSILAIADDSDPVAGVALTRMEVHHGEAARTAVDLLIKKIKSPAEPLPATAIAPAFRQGATCGGAVLTSR